LHLKITSKQYAMKHKLLLLAFVLLLAVTAQAQDYIVTPERALPSRVINMEMRNIMELRDGGILANVQLFDEVTGADYGFVLYKIEYDSVGAAVTDSVFIEDSDMNYFLLERNPFDNDNVLAKIVCDYDAQRSNLRISFFDDNLNFKPEKEIQVPMSDTLIKPLSDSYILDDSGDMVFFYKIESRKEHHIVKVDLDGTEKAHKILSYDDNPIDTHATLGIFNKNPLEYCLWGEHEGNPLPDSLFDPTTPPVEDYNIMRFVVLDSLLNVERTFAHNSPPDHYHFSYGWDSFQSIGDTSFLFFTNCDTIQCYYLAPDTCICDPHDFVNYHGICLSKSGKSDGKNYAARIQSYSYCVYPIEVKKSFDGNVFTAFYAGGVTVAKLTPNMETIWESKRSGGTQYFDKMVALENGGVAVGGLNANFSEDYSSYSLGIFFVIFKDGTFSLPENKTEERPYTFYPNPANDELNLNISSDVEPSMIELYDIQGRMVRNQQNGFEKVSLRGLPAGTYALRVSLKNGKSYTSTVVKK